MYLRCSDDAAYYKDSPKDDPPGSTTDAPHTIRGGSLVSNPLELRSAIRGSLSPAIVSGNGLGLRVVLSCEASP